MATKTRAKAGHTEVGDLKVWWIPQVPMEKAFEVKVANIVEAKLLLEALGYYDLYQLENNIKPDFANAGGVNVWDGTEWIDYCPMDNKAHAAALKSMGDWADSLDDLTIEEVRELHRRLTTNPTKLGV